MVSCLHFANHLELFKVFSVQGSFCLTGPVSGTLQLSSIQTNLPKCVGNHLVVSGSITFGPAASPIVGKLTPTTLITNAHGQVLKRAAIPVSLASRLDECQTIISSDLTFEVPHLHLEAQLPHQCLRVTCCATTCCDPFLVTSQGIAFSMEGTTVLADLFFYNMSATPFTVQSIQVSIADFATPANLTNVPVTITGSTVIPPIEGRSSVPSIPIRFTLPSTDPLVIIYKYELAASSASDPRVCQRGTGAIVPTFDGSMRVPQTLPVPYY